MKAHDRAVALRKHVAEIKEAQKHERHAEALEDKRAALKACRDQLESIVGPAAVLVTNKCMESDRLPDSDKVEEALKSVLDSFREDPGSITKGRNFTALTGHLESLAAEIRRTTLSAWSDEVGRAPKTNASLLDKIGRLRGQRRAVDDLRLASARLAETAKSPAADQAQWENYKNLLRLVTEKVEALNAEHFPPAALEFCIAAQSEGAPVPMLTEEIRVWLKNNGMFDDLRYRFK